MNGPRVIYVLGTPRSGSTLVTSLLGGEPGVFAAGELRLLWREHPHRTCGCGSLTQDCPVWGEVLRRLAERRITPAAVRSGLGATSMARLPRILAAAGPRDLPADARRHGEVLAATYRLLGEVAGAHTIVDSSKSAAEAALLRHVAGLRAHVVHIVRDPRAVAYSWHRAVSRGAVGTPPRPTWSIALRWDLTNGASEAVARAYRTDAVRLRYEDLVADPTGWRAQLVERFGLGPPPAAPQDGRRHIVGGNRLRRSAAPPEIRPDDAWRARFPAPAAAEVAGLTLPLLRRYHYPVRVRR